MSTEDGRLPINPREHGPVDLARMANDRVRAFVDENALPLILAFALLTVGAWHYDVSLPRLPNWLLVGILATVVAAIPASWTGWKLGKALHKPTHVLLSVQNPANGDQKLVWLAPERFDSMRVLNHNDKLRERDFLHEVRVNGRRAYEVDQYNAEQNVAVASWQAGVSNSEMRRKKSSIQRIKTTLEEEADKSLELLANHPDILRQQAREVSNRIVKVAEGVEVPQGGELHEQMGKILEEADPSEDLLEGTSDLQNGLDEDEGETLEDELGDIFDRAKGNGSEAPADD